MNLEWIGFGDDLIFFFFFFNTDFRYNSFYIRKKPSFLINQCSQVVCEQFCFDNIRVTLLILTSNQIYLLCNLIFRVQRNIPCYNRKVRRIPCCINILSQLYIVACHSNECFRCFLGVIFHVY